MKDTLELRKPLIINGAEKKELTYDIEEITPALFAQADALKKQAAGQKSVAVTPAVEFDFALHIFLGFAAIIAINPEITFEDLDRMKGFDLMSVNAIGRNFTLKVEGSQESNSDTCSETTPEPSTAALPSSNDDQ